MQKLTPLLLFLAACSQKAPEAPPAPRVKIATVTEATIPIKIDAVGHFVAYNSAEIKAQVEGRLLTVHFQEGSIVQEGDLLFTIDPRTYEADLEKAIADLEMSRLNFKYATEKVGMYEGLIPDQYVSPLNFLGYMTESGSYEAEVMKNEAAVRKAEINLDFCFIKAPFTGVTSKRLIDIGNLIVNNGSPLLTIKQIDPIFVDFSIPERDFLRLMREQKKNDRELLITFPDRPNDPFTGRLVLIENEIDQKTGMIPLRGELQNCDSLFWPGQFVRVQLILHEEKNALIVPEEAVNIGQKGYYIFVLDSSGLPEYRPIEIGETLGNLVQIKNGVKLGDKVITAGQLNVRPKHPINIVESQ